MPFDVGANSVDTTIVFEEYPLNPLIKNATTGNGGLSAEGQLFYGGPYSQHYFTMSAIFGGSGGTSQMAITTM